MTGRLPARVVRLLLVLVVVGLAIAPLYWMLVTSLTPSGELFRAAPRLLPDLDQLHVYNDVLASQSILLWLRNSAIVALGTMVLSVALATLAAYALSRFRFRGLLLVGFGLFMTQMLPEPMLVVPLYAIFRDLDLLNSLRGLVLANTAFVLPVITWILKTAVDAVPIEVEEAARVDGCPRIGILLSIVLPLITPTLAASAVIAFFHGWNEYIFAQTFVSDQSLRTASVGLASFVGELSTPIHSVMAVGFMYTLPAVVFYLFAQRYVVAGLTGGSVKG